MDNKVILASVALVLLALIPMGDAECCGYWHSYKGSGWNIVYRCADCTQPAFKYCGYGGCNMFGCNCECRRPVEGRSCDIHCCDRSDRTARDVDGVTLDSTPIAPLAANYTGNDVMEYVDTNKDGRLDEIEVKIFATRHGLADDDSWRSLDTDGDNHLSAHEIDDMLVPAPYFTTA